MKKLLIFLAILVLTSTAMAETQKNEFGILTDTAGKVILQREHQNQEVDFGSPLLNGDTLILEKNATLTAVSYEHCFEWNLTGPGTFQLSEGSFIQGDNEIEPLRKLPVCYQPDNLKDSNSRNIGGITLRSSQKEIVLLRRELNAGDKNKTNLLTLTLYELRKNNSDRARKYYTQLTQLVDKSKLCKIKELSELANCQ